jgi:hypothetical protein
VNLLEVIRCVEEGFDPNEYSEYEVLEGVLEHRDILRQLQGSWGRLVARLEQEGIE